MSSSLKPTQNLILWFLIAKGGNAWRSEIRPEPSAADRRSLEKAGLIAGEKRGRSLWLEVTDAGWAWANDHLDAPLPVRTQSAGPILQAWLTHLGAFLRRRGIALADVITVGSEQLPEDIKAGSTLIEDQIRRAYLEASGGNWNERVRLAELRRRLHGIGRNALDATLLRMQQASKLVLFRLDNQREITDGDRDAALLLGGEPRHLIRMGG